jgi:hypothetical protein
LTSDRWKRPWRRFFSCYPPSRWKHRTNVGPAESLAQWLTDRCSSGISMGRHCYCRKDERMYILDHCPSSLKTNHDSEGSSTLLYRSSNLSFCATIAESSFLEDGKEIQLREQIWDWCVMHAVTAFQKPSCERRADGFKKLGTFPVLGLSP